MRKILSSMKNSLVNKLMFFVGILTILTVTYRFLFVKSQNIELQAKYDSLSENFNRIIKVVKQSNTCDYLKLNDSRLKNVISGQSISISSLLQAPNNINIVYRVMNTTCEICNKKQIAKIEFLKKFDNTIILTNEINTRSILWFLKEKDIKCDIYQIDNDDEIFKGDDKNKALLAYVDNDGAILKAFFFTEEDLFLLNEIIPE